MDLPAVPWAQAVKAAPDLAAAVLSRLTATKHHVLATLRADGSPRVSGTEVAMVDGELRLGSMPGAARARDLLADPRCAVHANPGDGSMQGGDAKLDAVAEPLTSQETAAWAADLPEEVASMHAFRLLVVRLVLTEVGEAGLMVTSWTSQRGVRAVTRA